MFGEIEGDRLVAIPPVARIPHLTEYGFDVIVQDVNRVLLQLVALSLETSELREVVVVAIYVEEGGADMYGGVNGSTNAAKLM